MGKKKDYRPCFGFCMGWGGLGGGGVWGGWWFFFLCVGFLVFFLFGCGFFFLWLCLKLFWVWGPFLVANFGFFFLCFFWGSGGWLVDCFGWRWGWGGGLDGVGGGGGLVGGGVSVLVVGVCWGFFVGFLGVGFCFGGVGFYFGFLYFWVLGWVGGGVGLGCAVFVLGLFSWFF